MPSLADFFKKKSSTKDMYKDFIDDRTASIVFKKNLEKRGLSIEQGRKIFEDVKRLSSTTPRLSGGKKKKTVKRKKRASLKK